MPKYGHQLSKLGLRLFIQRFQRWTEAKRLTVPQAKLTLPLAFSNAIAQHYFMINFAEQDDPNIDWATFIKNFLTKCPMEVDDPTSILDILKRPKPDLEKASVYLQRLRAAMSEEYSRHAEPDVIRLLMDNLDPALRQFLECKGPPLNYSDLVSLVKHYEDRGLQKTLTAQPPPPQTNFTLPAPAPVAAVGLDAFAGLQQPPAAPPGPPSAPANCTDNALGIKLQTNFTDIQGLVKHVNELQAAIMQLNISPDQPARPHSHDQAGQSARGNGRRSQECSYCGQGGHVITNCYKKMRDEGVEVHTRGRGRGRGNPRGRSFGDRRDAPPRDFHMVRRSDNFPRDYRRRDESPRDYRRRDESPREYRRRDESPRDLRRRHDFSPQDSRRNSDSRGSNTRRRDDRAARSPPRSPSPSGNGDPWAD